jgi:ABC-type multidrug transport system fused ATPase/permease subunit
VSDQICLNLNVSLRSLTQAAIVLIFMFQASWRLSIITFIMIPAIITITKLYGAYYRRARAHALPFCLSSSFLPCTAFHHGYFETLHLQHVQRSLPVGSLSGRAATNRGCMPHRNRSGCCLRMRRELAKAVPSELSGVQTGVYAADVQRWVMQHMRMRRELAKAVQSELAGANAVAEEALSCMATVRSHAAEGSTRAAYQQRLRAFYSLQVPGPPQNQMPNPHGHQKGACMPLEPRLPRIRQQQLIVHIAIRGLLIVTRVGCTIEAPTSCGQVSRSR